MTDAVARQVIGRARNIARRVARTYGLHFLRDDMEGRAILECVRYYDSYDPSLGAEPLTFLHARIEGAVLDEVRSWLGRNGRKSGEQLSDGLADVEHAETTADDELVHRALVKLPAQQRSALVLMYWDDMRMREVGIMLGVSESRISQIHSQAIERLRKELAA